MGKLSGVELYNNPSMKYLLLPKYKLLRHSIFIGIVLLFWFAFDIKNIIKGGVIPLVQLIAYASTYIAAVYLNFKVLMPRLLLKNKIWQYLVLTYATFLIGYFLQQAIYAKSWNEIVTFFTPGFDLYRDMIINAITFSMFCGLGWAFSMFRLWLTDENRIQELKGENLKAELSNLKNQVNPHFLFNAFNNLYVSSKATPSKVPNMILDLSDLMRYQLDECSKDKVLLESEIKYIQSFINIERERKLEADIKFTIEGDTTDISVEPLLFVTLVENAFKHGLGKLDNDGYVFITLSTRNKGKLHLTVTNNKPINSSIPTEKREGIGLENLRKRLQLAYPNKHNLTIVDTNHVFKATLELQLE